MKAQRLQVLNVPPELAEALALARIRHDISAPAELDDEQVRRVEAALETRIPDTILALAAAMEQDLTTLADLTHDARDAGLDPQFIAFAFGDDGYWCVRGGRRAREVLVGRWNPDEADPLLECGVARFVRRRFGLLDGASEAEQKEMADELKVFRPAVRRRPPTAVRVVQHPKFGEGQVLRELHDGHHKLEIQFAAGKKTILASFVTEVKSSRAA